MTDNPIIRRARRARRLAAQRPTPAGLGRLKYLADVLAGVLAAIALFLSWILVLVAVFGKFR
jgi:hypothetical protein